MRPLLTVRKFLGDISQPYLSATCQSQRRLRALAAYESSWGWPTTVLRQRELFSPTFKRHTLCAPLVNAGAELKAERTNNWRPWTQRRRAIRAASYSGQTCFSIFWLTSLAWKLRVNTRLVMHLGDTFRFYWPKPRLNLA